MEAADPDSRRARLVVPKDRWLDRVLQPRLRDRGGPEQHRSTRKARTLVSPSATSRSSRSATRCTASTRTSCAGVVTTGPPRTACTSRSTPPTSRSRRWARRWPVTNLGEMVRKANKPVAWRAVVRPLTLAEVLMYGNGVERPFLCPVHGDRRPSASVNVIKRKWFCYTCGAHGGLTGEDALIEPDYEQMTAGSRTSWPRTRPTPRAGWCSTPRATMHPYWEHV